MRSSTTSPTVSATTCGGADSRNGPTAGATSKTMLAAICPLSLAQAGRLRAACSPKASTAHWRDFAGESPLKIAAASSVLALLLLLALLVCSTEKAFAARPLLHLKLWLCVHHQEHSAWNDTGAPYWGGLQMGAWFIGHYAHPPGTPDQWTPMQQMWVAENAWRRERYSVAWLRGQWPPSRGVCF